MVTNERDPPWGPDYFPADVTIRDTQTGEARRYATWQPLPDEDGFHEFIWTDGNFSCDCNRQLFFGYAAGLDYQGIEHPCGDGRFIVESIVDARDGTVVYAESADPELSKA